MRGGPSPETARNFMDIMSRNSGAGALVLAMALLQVPATAAVPAQPIERLEAEAKARWLRRDEPAGARAAVALYDRITALEPGRAEYQVSLARALWWYAMMRPAAAVVERRALLGRSVDAARRAQRLAPRDPGGFYWEAASRAQAAALGGWAVAPGEIWRVRSLVARVRAMNPWYHHGTIRTVEAELILAMPAWERWITGEGRGRSVDLAMEALGFENSCLHGHWVLARSLEAAGRLGAALAQLDFILRARPDAFLPDAPENRVVKRWAAAMRATLVGRR